MAFFLVGCRISSDDVVNGFLLKGFIFGEEVVEGFKVVFHGVWKAGAGYLRVVVL